MIRYYKAIIVVYPISNFCFVKNPPKQLNIMQISSIIMPENKTTELFISKWYL